MGDPVSTALKQHGKTKRASHRQLLIAAAGAVLLVVYLVHRRSSSTAQAAVPATVDTTALPAGSGGAPATFADNGAQAATLGTDVTNSLSGLQTSLDAQTSAFETLLQGLSQPAADAAPASSPSTSADTPAAAAAAAQPPVTINFGAPLGAQPPNTPAGDIGQPAQAPAAAPPAAASATRVNTQAGNPRAGQSFTPGTYKGKNVHVYSGPVKNGVGPGKNLIVVK